MSTVAVASALSVLTTARQAVVDTQLAVASLQNGRAAAAMCVAATAGVGSAAMRVTRTAELPASARAAGRETGAASHAIVSSRARRASAARRSAHPRAQTHRRRGQASMRRARGRPAQRGSERLADDTIVAEVAVVMAVAAGGVAAAVEAAVQRLHFQRWMSSSAAE